MNRITAVIAERFSPEREAWTGGGVLIAGIILQMAEVGPDWIQVPTAVISVPMIAHGLRRDLNAFDDSHFDSTTA